MRPPAFLYSALLCAAFAAPPAQAAEPDWALPAVPEDAETRLNCQGLIAVMPITAHAMFKPVMARAQAGERLSNGELVLLVQKLAQSGDGDGLDALGLLFESGSCFGGRRNAKRAKDFYELAADRGNASAARRLGR